MLIAILALLIMLDRLDRAVRRGRVELLIIETRHKIFRLRDVLRSEAILGYLDANHWLFRYFDVTLTHAAASIASWSVYDLVAYMVVVDRIPKHVQERFQIIEEELRKPKNSRFKAIHAGFSTCVSDFLKARNRFVVPTFKAFVAFLSSLITKLERRADAPPTHSTAGRPYVARRPHREGWRAPEEVKGEALEILINEDPRFACRKTRLYWTPIPSSDSEEKPDDIVHA